MAKTVRTLTRTYADDTGGRDTEDGSERFTKPCVACSIHAGGAQINRSETASSWLESA